MNSDRQARRVRIVIVDDHELARAGLRSILADEPDLEVVGEAANGSEAQQLCRRLEPDLVLTDMRMPDLDGLAVTRAIKRDHPTTSVIIVTMHEDLQCLAEALQAGAAGYVLKDATRREVLTAVRQVLRGESPLSPKLVTQLLRRAHEGTARPEGRTLERLTPREREVLELVVRGQTNREIARGLGVGLGTVKAHIEHIIAKLGVSDRTQAAVRAVELGLITPARR